MNDLAIMSKSKEEHFKHLDMVFKVLEERGLKVSPRKCHLFRKKMAHMGYQILIKDGRPCITALKSKTEAIDNMPVPKTKRQVRGFIGACQYLAMFCPELQHLLRPICKLTRKSCPFQR